MNKPMAKGLVPELRFPEFRNIEEWKNIKFYDLLADVLDFRGRTPKKMGMDWGGGDIISLSANNVKNGYIDFEAECNLGSLELYQKWMGEVNLERGDIVFTMEAPLGNALIVPDSRKYILSQRVVAFKTKKSILNQFLIQLIWSEVFQAKINLLSTGSTAKGINQKTLKTVNVTIPSQKEEQQKIADCLSSLDELVSAHSQKLEALKAHKKGLMQNLFPAEGETVPKLRFPEFKGGDKWKQKALGNAEVSTFVKERVTLEQLKLSSYVSTENIQANYAGIAKASKLPPSGSFTSYKPNDVLISNIRPYLKKVWSADKNGAASNDVIVIRPSNKVSSTYLLHILKNDEFINFVMKGAKGVKMPRGDIASIQAYPVALPKNNEQQKIADCLSSLDELITAQSQKIEALKMHKKGLMQQLFPAMDEVGI